MSATETTIKKATKDTREMAMESSVQQVTLAWSKDLASTEESISVSRVPPSFSPTNTRAAAVTEQTMGTHKNSMGHSRVVKAAIHWRRGP